MWLILQEDTPDDYVCSTGISHSVRDLCQFVFTYLGMNYRDYITQDEKFLRPEELRNLKGDSSKLVNKLGWEHEYTFETMLIEMIEYWKTQLSNESKTPISFNKDIISKDDYYTEADIKK